MKLRNQRSLWPELSTVNDNQFKEAKQKQQVQQLSTVNVNNQVEVTAQETQSTSQRQGYAKVRLPKQTMSRFKGDLTKWNCFWDSFNASIHKNNEISTIGKFIYLNSLRKRRPSNTRTTVN